MSGFTPPGYCPNCGEFVEEGAGSCPSCGSCDDTGWAEESVYDGLELPEEERDFETEVAKESGNMWRLVLAGILITLVLYFFVF